MTTGMSAFTANGWLNALFNNTSFVVAQAYIQLHTADPGAAGTTAVATETTRKAIPTGVAAVGAIASDTIITWTGIAATGIEDPTHWTAWDAAVAGNFLGSGTITANAYTAGDTYNIPVGDFDVVLTVAA